MSRKTMSKVALVASILCLLMAVIVFVLVEGLRRWYSGIFFTVMGLVMLVNTLRWGRVADGHQDPLTATRFEAVQREVGNDLE